MKRASFVLLFLLATVAPACVPVAKQGGSGHLGGGKESAAAPGFPVTRKLPGNVTMFAASARLDQAVQLIRDVLKPLGRAEENADPARLDAYMRKQIGTSPISAADLADFGFAVERNFAIYSTGFLPTFVLPVADATRVNERLGKLLQGAKLVVSEHRGLNLTVIREGNMFVAWVNTGEWLFVHIGAEGSEPSTTAWLNEILDSKSALALQDDLEWAWQRAEGQKDALGFVRAPALFAAARVLDRPETHTPACDQMNASIASAFGRIAVSGALAEGKADLRGFVELSPPASSALAAHVGGVPDSAFLSLREQAGFAISAGIDLDWVGPLARSYQSYDCGIVPRFIKETDLDEVADPLTKELGRRAVSSYHVALMGGSVSFSGADVQAVAFLGVVDPGALKSLLGQLGSGQTTKVSGVDVVQVSIPGASQPLEYTLGGGALHAAMGPGLMAKLLANTKPLSNGPSPEIMSFAVRPDKLPDLLSALQLVGGHDAEILAHWLGEYRWIRTAITSENGGVRVVGGFELR